MKKNLPTLYKQLKLYHTAMKEPLALPKKNCKEPILQMKELHSKNSIIEEKSITTFLTAESGHVHGKTKKKSRGIFSAIETIHMENKLEILNKLIYTYKYRNTNTFKNNLIENKIKCVRNK